MRILSVFALALVAAGCAAPIPPVTVTRFNNGQPQQFGPVGVVAAQGQDGQGLEFRTYAAAVMRELVRVGFAETGATESWIAEVDVWQGSRTDAARQSPFSVGIGGGSFGRNVGIGVGTSFPIGSARAREIMVTRLSVRIKRKADDVVVWEGRAQTEARLGAPAAQPGLAADKLARALFTGFPGKSGETITIP
jgi:hypothetical protein